MDIFAHGLWTNAVYEIIARKKRAKRTRHDAQIAVFFGIVPDILAFGVGLVASLFAGSASSFFSFAYARFVQEWGGVLHMDNIPSALSVPALVPHITYTLYNLTHSFIIFLAVFLIVWLIRRRPYWLMAGWGLHILVDIFTHSAKFFPTLVFYPFSSRHTSGISWANPVFMLANYSCLAIIYLWLYPPSRSNKHANQELTPDKRSETQDL